MYSLTSPASNLQPRFNVGPTDKVDAVVDHQLVSMRWGLIPAWWGKPLKEFKLATFNARAETVAEKPMFRSAFKNSRCLIPASGYYEWQNTPEGKQPFYFTRRDGQVMTIAGLWSGWVENASGETVMSCTMLITAPNKFVADVHDRMPVILEAKNFERWEHGNANDATALTKPAREDVLQMWPVSKRVNSSRADGDDATLIDMIAA
jgi:putative SOS response-associated peptidase YedK